MRVNRTRERILDVSLQLFNEKKASNVSTVQISAAMKISPGNLYYYYANKEEVIRCIWNERMVGKIDELLAELNEIAVAEDMFNYLESVFSHMAEYKFFYTEMPTLFINDNELIGMYRESEVKIAEAIADLYDRWHEAGLVIDIDEEERDIVGENLTALAHKMVLGYDMAKFLGKDFSDFMMEAWIRIIYYLKPYFTETMREEVRKEMDAREISLKKYYELRG